MILRHQLLAEAFVPMRIHAVIANLTSSTLACALAFAPTVAVAAPAGDAAEDAADAAPEEGAEAEPAEGDAAEGDPAEGGEPAEGDGAAPPEEGEVMPDLPPEEPEPEPEPEPEAAEEPPPPEPDPESERPEEPQINGKPRTGKGMMIAGGSALAAGIGLTAGFAAMTRGCSLDGPLECRYETQDQFLIPLGAAVIVTGTILLAVGVGYHFNYKKWQAWTPEDDKKKRRRRAAIPAPTLVKGGGGLGWAGRF